MNQEMQVLTSTATVDWYTPPEYVELAREVLGEIDLDPASSALPQSWIRAREWRGLDLSNWQLPTGWGDAERRRWMRQESRRQLNLQPAWNGRVWLNSPFDDTPTWTARLWREHKTGYCTAAIQLCNSNLGYSWYERLWRAVPVCCVERRIKFIKADGSEGGQSKQGQTFAYYGTDVATFKRVFGHLGRIFLPE